MSQLLLFQLSEAVSGITTPDHSFKHTSNSHAILAHLIIHHYEDDLEGPLGVKCVLDKSHNWLLHKWSTTTFKDCNNKKTTFFYHLHAHKFEEQFHSFFKKLVPLVVEWYELIRSKGPSHAITFQEVLDLINKHLAKFPEKLSPEILFTWKVFKELPTPELPIATTCPAYVIRSNLLFKPTHIQQCNLELGGERTYYEVYKKSCK
ncbi:hypothetical protein BDR06DRAFT_967637 [Suillus hirtellus]|nr:hypothetical protein BDR06DRAFT_967637 [Suillus hirtellus]